MSSILIKCEDEYIKVLVGNDQFATIKIEEEHPDLFQEWINTYNQALKKSEKLHTPILTGNTKTSPTAPQQQILLQIGSQIYDWLNGKTGWFDRFLKKTPPPLIITIQIPGSPSELQKTFLELPWELLADSQGHLANDSDLKFSPVRRVGEAENRK